MEEEEFRPAGDEWAVEGAWSKGVGRAVEGGGDATVAGGRDGDWTGS